MGSLIGVLKDQDWNIMESELSNYRMKNSWESKIKMFDGIRMWYVCAVMAHGTAISSWVWGAYFFKPKIGISHSPRALSDLQFSGIPRSCLIIIIVIILPISLSILCVFLQCKLFDVNSIWYLSRLFTYIHSQRAINSTVCSVRLFNWDNYYLLQNEWFVMWCKKFTCYGLWVKLALGSQSRLLRDLHVSPLWAQLPGERNNTSTTCLLSRLVGLTTQKENSWSTNLTSTCLTR